MTEKQNNKDDNKYDHKLIENKWQGIWEGSDICRTPNEILGKKNLYALVEFPYPSGNLHIGHWYAFAVPDIFVRKKKMDGYNVLFPIGFDAFGLPAENAAIKRGLNPKKWTYENIAFMESQLRSMGASFDWSRKIITSNKEYYKWTQWLFLKLYERGLACKKEAFVNWCSSCQTVLANEQVVAGKCERCETEVYQKSLEQWFLKITNYAERLLSDLENLNWPEEIKTAQKNWIGKSSGATFKFPIYFCNDKVILDGKIQTKLEIEVFTTRADTLFGATYLVLAPEYKEIKNLELKIENWEEVKKYIEESKKKTEIERMDAKKEKTGIEIKGIKAINPATGEEIPVWVADYVFGNYGTGAVMAVPAHDDRDFEFAKKYNLSTIQVINTSDTKEKVYTGEGTLINSKEFDGMKSEEAREKIIEKFGKRETKYKLRDWLLSRQRYWGTPIPIVYDTEGNPHSVKEEHLPWVLPEDNIDFTPKGTSPLASSDELKERVEKLYGKGWTPEFDTMDTFIDSSWYFIAYCIYENIKSQTSISKQFRNSEIQSELKKWMPVDKYFGGAEHTTMHLLYSRFFHKALFDIGLVNENEPFKERLNRSLILGPDGQKMSKSKGNVVDPDLWVEKVGADTVRIYLAFIGPYNEVGQYPWDLGGIAGMRRFLERVWKTGLKVHKDASLENKNEKKEKEKLVTSELHLETLLHKTIKKVTEDVEIYKFNTAISSLMIFFNEFEKRPNLNRIYFETFLKLLAPFVPHITEEIWHNLGHQNSIHIEKWPKYDEIKIKSEKVSIAVSINGKVRMVVELDNDMNEEEVIGMTLKREEIKKWIDGKDIKKVIFVKNRLVNFLIE